MRITGWGFWTSSENSISRAGPTVRPECSCLTCAPRYSHDQASLGSTDAHDSFTPHGFAACLPPTVHCHLSRWWTPWESRMGPCSRSIPHLSGPRSPDLESSPLSKTCGSQETQVALADRLCVLDILSQTSVSLPVTCEGEKSSSFLPAPRSLSLFLSLPDSSLQDSTGKPWVTCSGGTGPPPATCSQCCQEQPEAPLLPLVSLLFAFPATL